MLGQSLRRSSSAISYLLVRAIQQCHLSEQFVNITAFSLIQGGKETQIIPCGHLLIHGGELKIHADVLIEVLPVMIAFNAVHRHRPLIARNQANDNLLQCAFPGTGWPEKSKDLAFFTLKFISSMNGSFP